MRHYSMRLVAEGRADGRDVSLKKLDACVCVCECELDAAGVALSQIDKHNMRHYLMPSKRLVAEMRADARDVSLHRKGVASACSGD